MRGAATTLLLTVAGLTPLLPGAVVASTPFTLSCVEDATIGWRVAQPNLAAIEPDQPGRHIIHLNPQSGDWYLQAEGSAALTIDGGTFRVAGSGPEQPSDEWIGLDEDVMLRIAVGNPPLRFMAVSRDIGLVLGTCTEPDEPFLFLREPLS